MMGAMDFRYCIVLLVPLSTIYLETWHDAKLGSDKPFMFGSSDNPERTKDYVYHTLSRLWESPDFVPMAQGPGGTHSLRKFPSTYARRNGASIDDVKSRGRLKKARVTDVYMDVTLP